MAALPRRRALPGIRIDLGDASWRPRRVSQWGFSFRSSLASLLVHLVVIAVMACIVWDQSRRFVDDQILGILAGDEQADSPFEEVEPEAVLAELEPRSAESEIQQVLAQTESAEAPPDPEPDLGESEAEANSEEPTSQESESNQNQGGAKNRESSGGAADHGPKVTAGRSGPMKGELLKRFGGTGETESAVQLGLQWLAKQQTKDGSWSFRGPYPDGAAFQENRMAATSMALLAFLGAGHTHKSGDYQSEVDSALRWMVARQKRAGAMGANTPHHHTLYTHAQATLVLSEAYAMTEDPWLKPYCQSALDYAAKSQSPLGGWRYDYQGDSDTSVTGWMMMALISGRSAGLDVPEQTFQRIRNFLDLVASDGGEFYSYVPNRPPTPAMTAEGLLCRMYLGWPRGTSSLDRGAERLLTIAPFRVQEQAFYYWYYATQVMHHIGGESWQAWNDVMKVELPAAQIKVGPQAGSWNPGGRFLDQTAGRLYSTCMSIYCLEVYYRHLPIYDSPFDKVQARR